VIKSDGDGPRPGEVTYPQSVILVAAVADLAFTGAVAVHVVFNDVVGWTVALVIVSTLLFIAGTVVALVARRKKVVLVAVILVAVAGAGTLVASVADRGLRDQVSRRRAFRDPVEERSLEGAMLSSVSALIAGGAALPLVGYLAYRTFRAGRTP
jgi:hypothetical protein